MPPFNYLLSLHNPINPIQPRISTKSNFQIHFCSSLVQDGYQGAHLYNQHKWLDKKINAKKQKGKKGEDSLLSNELSNRMEISLLCYIKAHGTTPEYCISFFKAILDSSKHWEQWIAVNEGYSGRKEAKLNQLYDITF